MKRLHSKWKEQIQWKITFCLNEQRTNRDFTIGFRANWEKVHRNLISHTVKCFKQTNNIWKVIAFSDSLTKIEMRRYWFWRQQTMTLTNTKWNKFEINILPILDANITLCVNMNSLFMFCSFFSRLLWGLQSERNDFVFFLYFILASIQYN